MNDILAFYYENIYDPNKETLTINEISELCVLNPHLFQTAIHLHMTFVKKEKDYLESSVVVKQTQNYLGMLLAGVGLYLYYINHKVNAMRIFNLASPSGNIVVLAFLNNTGFDTIEFITTKIECEQIIYQLIGDCKCQKTIFKLLYDKLYLQYVIVNASINVENTEYESMINYKNKTYKEIKNAVELAIYSIDFDIENLYNFDELNNL
jgi:hypothetical protein